MSAPPDHLSKWITRLRADITEEGPIIRFEIWHSVDGGDSAERLEKIRVTDDSDPGDIIQLIWDSAEHDASTRNSGNQRYFVSAHRAEHDRDPDATFPFRINSRGAAGWTSGDTEGPTEKGERAQMMRHDENMHGIMMRYSEALGGRLATQLESETRRRIEAEALVAKMRLEHEDLLDRRLDRELEKKREELRIGQMDTLISAALSMLPVVIGKFMGRSGGISGEIAERVGRDAGLQTLLGNVSQEEAFGMIGALKPENRMAFMQFYAEYIKSAEAAKKKLESKPEEQPVEQTAAE